MKKANQTWLENLAKEGILEDFDTSFGTYYRFASSNFHIPDDKLSFLKKEYQPGLEKGGYFLVAPEKISGSVYFVVKEIHFLTNYSPTPWQSYRRNPVEKEKLVSYSLDKRLLPISFHSHPTESVNLLSEAFHFNQQMDTSQQDKLASLFSRIPIKKSELRLPEVLVVCNGRLKGDIFIGFYGGLIAPLDFSERQKTLKANFSDKVTDGVETFFDSPAKKGLGILAASALIFLTLRYPKPTLTTLATLVALTPSIAYTSLKNNEFFGISHGMSLQISLPNVDIEEIIKDEEYLLELYEQWKKGEFNKAA